MSQHPVAKQISTVPYNARVNDSFVFKDGLYHMFAITLYKRSTCRSLNLVLFPLDVISPHKAYRQICTDRNKLMENT